MAMSQFEEQMEKGSKTEEIIDELLRKNGWYTIPIYRHKYDPKHKREVAPRIYGIKEHITLPDILAFKSKAIWVECKHELGASWTYSVERFEHGLAGRLFDDYKKVKDVTGFPVWLMFHETNQLLRSVTDYENCKKRNKPLPPLDRDFYPNFLRGQRISFLVNPRYSNVGSNYTTTPYVYFQQKDFIPFGMIHEADLTLLEII
jgi:hypothetical protein